MPRGSARSIKTKFMGGRVVSAKSKTGDPQCSSAMSAWQNIRHGNPAGMALEAAMAILGKCRSKARALKQAGQHRTAGNEARAQHLEHRAQSGGPVSAKDRMAKARELRAGRAGKAPATSVKALEAKAKAHDRLYNEGGEGFNPHADAIRKANAREQQQFIKSVEAKANAREKRLTRYADSSRVQSNPEAIKRFGLEGRKPGSPLPGMSGAKIEANRKAVAKALKEKNPAVVAKWKAAKAARSAKQAPAPPAKPLHEQAISAASGVPASMRTGDKVFLHHAHAEYQKTGGKLSLDEFKKQLASTPEGRRNLSRADLVQAFRPEDVRASQATHDMGGGIKAEFNFIRVPKSTAPARPSLREQAAAHRAGKGTAQERAKSLVTRLNKKYTGADKSEAKLGKELDAVTRARNSIESRGEDASRLRASEQQIIAKAQKYTKTKSRLKSHKPAIDRAVRAAMAQR